MSRGRKRSQPQGGGRELKERSPAVSTSGSRNRDHDSASCTWRSGLDGDGGLLVAKRGTRSQLRKNELAGISSFGGLDSDAQGGPGGEVIGQGGG